MTSPGTEDFQAGNSEYTAGRYEEAASCFDRAVRAAPENPTYRYNRALTLLRLERYSAALEDLHRALELEPVEWDIWFLLGEVRARLGEKALALSNLREALARDRGNRDVMRAIDLLTDPAKSTTPTLHRYHFNLRITDPADVNDSARPVYIPSLSEVVRTGSDEALVVSIERELRTVPDDGEWDSTLKRAVLLSALHRREAGPAWERLLSFRSDIQRQEEILGRAIRAYYEAAEWDEILRLQGPEPPPPTQSIARHLAHALLATGRPGDSAKLLAQVSEPSDSTLRVLSGTYLALGDRPLALEVARRAVALSDSAAAKTLLSLTDRSWFSTQHPLDGLAGLDDVKIQIRERVVLPLLVPELYLGGAASNKFLMMGPPGCGKTTIAQLAAKEAHARLKTIHLTSVLNLFTGNSEANLTALFMEAKNATLDGPVILLIDEVDSIAIRREAMTQVGEHRLVTHFMDELDQLRGFPGLTVLAATNLPFVLDSAVLRSGRLGSPLYVGPPSSKAREALLVRHLRSVSHEEIDPARVADELEWYSPADFEHAFRVLNYTRNAQGLSGERHPLSLKEIEATFQEISPSVRLWLQQVLDRVHADPSLQGLIPAELQRNLDAIRAQTCGETPRKDTASGMFG